jgi:hypothetical protein
MAMRINAHGSVEYLLTMMALAFAKYVQSGRSKDVPMPQGFRERPL